MANPLIKRVETALENVDGVLENLQELFTDLTSLLAALKRAERNKKTEEPEGKAKGKEKDGDEWE